MSASVLLLATLLLAACGPPRPVLRDRFGKPCPTKHLDWIDPAFFQTWVKYCNELGSPEGRVTVERVPGALLEQAAGLRPTGQPVPEDDAR
jgi:hypothetical protein